MHSAKSDRNTTYFVHGSLIYQLPIDGSTMATVMFCIGYGDDTLCPVNIDLDPMPTLPASPSQTDIFYLNASTADSLTRVTNTANESEQPVQ